MKDLMDKLSIIKLKEQGYSNRKVEKLLKINRKTVGKYWNEYLENLNKLTNEKDNSKIVEIQEAITSAPKYNTQSRMRRKLTDDFFTQLQNILEAEEEKKKILGTNKQCLTKIQIYEILKKLGFNVGYSTVVAENYKFSSEEAAIEYMESQLIKLNENSKIEEEKRFLKPSKPPLELANIKESVVNKYSFIQIENNFYSVPEYLVGFTVTSKIYYNKILIYSNNEFVCEHKKLDGNKKISADIRHYLKTLTFKPGALKNSYVLKSNPKLKSIFDKYYTNNPKKFIDIISKNKENIILIGTPGAGKTHYAIGLGMKACIEGKSVLFVSVPNLIIELREALSRSALNAYKKKFEKYDLVILDELGYVSFDKEGCEILFNLLSNRNDKGSIIITTNLTFDRWEEIFKDAMLTGAMVDRLAYKAHILDISRDISHRYEETLSWKENK